MQCLRPIPRSLLPHTMVVEEPLVDGTYGNKRELRHVRFERTHEVVTDVHRSDAITGNVYVDAVMTDGAYEVSAGSRVIIEDVSLLVASVRRFEGANGRVHHWELDVR